MSVPLVLDYLKTNADGSGVSIYQSAQAACAALLSRGRGGVLVSFPRTAGQVSRRDIQSGKIAATIDHIQPERIINWRTETFGREVKTTLVVIAEEAEERAGYGFKKINRWRELVLEDEVYIERLWKEVAGRPELEDEYIPTDAAGATWSFIPFGFLGAETNTANPQKAPLWPLMVMNLKHYQNSADNEESVFFGVQNQPYIDSTEVTPEIVKELRAAGFSYGNRTLAPFPIGVASTPENTQVAKEMDRKRDALQALGARLMMAAQAAKTATQVEGEREGQTSVLAMIASNVSEAYTDALRWACAYMGAPDTDAAFTLNQDFVDIGMDPQLVQTIMSGYQLGSILPDDYVRFMKRLGIFDDEIEQQEYVEMLNAAAGNLGIEE
jgi:hypothetical protein